VSVNTKQAGFSIVELVTVLSVASVLLIATMTVSVYFYGSTVKSNLQARLAVESQNILRSIVEELRVSSGVRATNANADPHAPAGGWTTSNASLVLIIATPVIDTANNFVINPTTGEPYQNEIVYFANGNTLYKRYLADVNAPDNRFKTSCPATLATADCPADVKLSDTFKTMNFTFYDQDDVQTIDLAAARSINMTIYMERKTFGDTLTFTNNIRITLRNSL